MLLRGFDCAGTLVNDRGSGPAAFVFSPSLREASVAGTITTRDGRTVTVGVRWDGVGRLEETSNTTTLPGFVGRFQGRRDAVATWTVVVDGVTLVDGSTATPRSRCWTTGTSRRARSAPASAGGMRCRPPRRHG